MKNVITLLLALIIFMFAAPAAAHNVTTGISIGDRELKSFYLAIRDYYRVPEPRVVQVKKHYRVRDEELPVVFFLASCAHVDPDVIIDLRFRQRMSWLNITFHFGLTPEIYYVPVQRVGPPYGKAYRHYKQHKHDYKGEDVDRGIDKPKEPGKERERQRAKTESNDLDMRIFRRNPSG